MRFVGIRELRVRSAAVWKALAEEKDLVVTSNGKPIALLSATSEDILEQSLSALRRACSQAAADRLSPEEINTEINAVRRERTR